MPPGFRAYWQGQRWGAGQSRSFPCFVLQSLPYFENKINSSVAGQCYAVIFCHGNLPMFCSLYGHVLGPFEILHGLWY